MASKEDNIKPRFVKIQIPVCSTEYKKISREVKERRLAIETKEIEVKLLKQRFETLLHDHDDDRTESETEKVELGSSPAKVLPADGTGSLRTVIITPKGTKRKVCPTHIKFQMDVTNILESIVKVDVDSELTVDDLFNRLEEVSPGVKRLERTKILRTLAGIFNMKLKHRGRKREGYYSGLGLISSDSINTSQLPSKSPDKESLPISPQQKIKKGCEEHPPMKTCKGQLFFSDPEKGISESVDWDGLTDMYMDDVDTCIATKMDDLCLTSSSTCHEQFKESEETATSVSLQNNLCAMYSLVDKLRGDIMLMKGEKEQMKANIKKLEQSLAEYEQCTTKLVSKQDETIQLYKEITESGGFLGGLLSLAERNAIVAAVKKANELFNLGIRNNETKDLIEVVDVLLFNKLLEKLKTECPTISNILEQLVLSANVSRNTIKTPAMKMKAAVHLLSSLLNVRDQRSGNDIPVLFGFYVCAMALDHQ